MSRVRVRGAGGRSQSCFAAHAQYPTSIQHWIPCPALGAEGSPCPSWGALCRARGLWNILQLPINLCLRWSSLQQFPAALWFVLETWKREFWGWLRHCFFPLGFPAVPAQQPSLSSGCLSCKFSKISWRKFYKMSFKKTQRESWMFSQSCTDFGKDVVDFRG